MRQIEFGMFSYDILGYLGYRPIQVRGRSTKIEVPPHVHVIRMSEWYDCHVEQVMATVWDPASRPSHKSGEWPYLYYFEIWHERSLAMLRS